MNSSSTESIAERNRIIGAHRELILEIRELEPEISKLVANRDPCWRELEQKAQRVSQRDRAFDRGILELGFGGTLEPMSVLSKESGAPV